MTFLKQHTESCEKPTRTITRSFSDIVNAVYFKIGKRVLDIFLAATGLIILSPLFVFIYSVLWFETKGNVFFFQLRPGLNEKIFVLNKFRTLSDVQRKSYLPNDQPVVLPFGRLLRQSSLDEIPQLWNVLKGDMSLIGPRPLLPEYLNLYNPEQHMRHDVLPGITGWAQVNGRTAIAWEKKFELDIWYVKNQSFGLDMKILYLTFIMIFKRPGKQTHSSFKRFTGS
ncbi:sugar transferase [Dyadobacter sp. CY107]|uniref:sugar transferase n=1 Tax=Dyadobacter fanqingshengii TaxID=2906443 RepID=UPI001F1C35E2|nr:sugar transferase [Dyadobacter fanqingshengii]MCF2506527.1 sugar transferase [Dyadobacter fanqingshengii]